MLKKNIYNFIFLLVIILGIITPFIDYFVAIQMFYLLIPCGVILLVSIFLFIYNLLRHKQNIFRHTSTKIILILPAFLFMQILSTYAVDKIQRFRSEQIIRNLVHNKNYYPNSTHKTLGIEYKKSPNSIHFEIKYERGFFVREIYDSQKKSWESYGWND